MDTNTFPQHAYSLILTHNPHKDDLSSVEHWESDVGVGAEDWVSPKQRAKAISTNDFWTLEWTIDPEKEENQSLIAADLDTLLKAAKNIA